MTDTSSSDLIERMAEAGRQNKGSIYTEMHAAARVMLDAIRNYKQRTGTDSFSMIGRHGQNVLNAFAKENDLE